MQVSGQSGLVPDCGFGAGHASHIRRLPKLFSSQQQVCCLDFCEDASSIIVPVESRDPACELEKDDALRVPRAHVAPGVRKAIRNDDNPESGAVGGGPTRDRVFLLSDDEADELIGGGFLFHWDYFSEDGEWFWLRSQGEANGWPAFLCFSSYTWCEHYGLEYGAFDNDPPESFIMKRGGDGGSVEYGILPAMWVLKA